MFLCSLTDLSSFPVLEFLENITPTEPMEDHINWDDDEPAAKGVVASFGHGYGQATFNAQPLDPEVEDLQDSVVSYPGEDKNAPTGKRTPGAHRSVSACLPSLVSQPKFDALAAARFPRRRSTQ